MATRRVTRTITAADGRILALSNPDSWGEVDLEAAIWHIENRLATYYLDQSGHRAELKVVSGLNGKYLRPEPAESSAA